MTVGDRLRCKNLWETNILGPGLAVTSLFAGFLLVSTTLVSICFVVFVWSHFMGHAFWESFGGASATSVGQKESRLGHGGGKWGDCYCTSRAAIVATGGLISEGDNSEGVGKLWETWGLCK